jgi:uncharacterized Ntn-hydrolase superfamily protein
MLGDDGGSAMTYSIVARDAVTGDLGIAVQTCFFAVGSTVPWARPGVGAVATQAITEPAYGPRCLDQLALGISAPEALSAAQADDPMTALRQVGVVGSDGSAAVTTGELCIDHAGDFVGDGFVVQANMMSTPEVWSAMASTFSDSSASFAHRLLAALTAGEAAGGDARGRMSAALLVVAGEAPAQPGAGKLVDLRVDRSEDPLGDLSTLLIASEAFAGFSVAVDLLFSGDPTQALALVDDALVFLPRDENLRFLRSGALVASGALDTGIAELRSLIAERPTWEVVVRSFATKGLFALPEGASIDAVFG